LVVKGEHKVLWRDESEHWSERRCSLYCDHVNKLKQNTVF